MKNKILLIPGDILAQSLWQQGWGVWLVYNHLIGRGIRPMVKKFESQSKVDKPTIKSIILDIIGWDLMWKQ